MGSQAEQIAPSSGFSKRNMGMADNTPQTRNWMQESFTPSTFGEK